MKKKIILAITGASGAIYADRFIEKIQEFKNKIETFDIIYSNAGKDVWKYELNKNIVSNFGNIIENNNFFSAPASGSANYDIMIVVPCTMGTLGKIANGVSDDLICRAADVVLKERKKLILMIRETPYSLIHIKNMELVTQAGAVVLPASPSFYSMPKNINELVDTIVFRLIEHIDFNIDYKRWGM